MLGNNEDLKAKIADGTLSVQTYDQVKPQLKKITRRCFQCIKSITGRYSKLKCI